MLDKYEETTCSCDICQKMCERPCWGTPADIQKLIDAGFGDKLMLDYWAASPDIYLISPALVGYEREMAPFWPSGLCTFLTEEGLCKLHDLGLKPSEGKIAHHDKKNKNLHFDVAKTWDNQEGRNLVRFWEDSYR